MTYNPPPSGPSGWPGPPQYPAGMSGPPPAWQPPRKSFFGALFDFGFNHFVTPSIVKVLYILGLVGIVIGYLVAVIGGFSNSAEVGTVVMLLGAVMAVIYLAFWRVTLEFLFAVIRMSEDIHHRGTTGIH